MTAMVLHQSYMTLAFTLISYFAIVVSFILISSSLTIGFLIAQWPSVPFLFNSWVIWNDNKLETCKCLRNDLQQRNLPRDTSEVTKAKRNDATCNKAKPSFLKAERVFFLSPTKPIDCFRCYKTGPPNENVWLHIWVPLEFFHFWQTSNFCHVHYNVIL